jgi:hypothetical protein
MKLFEVCLDVKSNCRNQNQFVVQAWSNVDGWQDTKYSADTEEEAREMGRNVLNNKSLWINLPTSVRVVTSLGKPYKTEI